MNNNTFPLADIRCICFLIAFASAIITPVQISAQEFYPATCYGGKQHLKDFLTEHMVYPRAELAAGRDGSVSLAFDIDAKGLPEEVKTLQTSGSAFTAEAMRLFRLLLWTPASVRGKAVNDHQELTISFSCKHYHKACRIRGYDTITYPYRPADTTLKIFSCRLTKLAPEPIFGDNDASMQSFFAKNFRYPAASLSQNVSGIVMVSFVIEPYGIISNVTADDHLGAGCAEEAIRLAKLIRWKPGIVNGKAVRVYMNLSVTFGPDLDDGIHFRPQQVEDALN
jgi:TonB family protein